MSNITAVKDAPLNREELAAALANAARLAKEHAAAAQLIKDYCTQVYGAEPADMGAVFVNESIWNGDQTYTPEEFWTEIDVCIDELKPWYRQREGIHKPTVQIGS